MSAPIWSASVIHTNLGRLEEEFQALESAGCHELHFDVVDGVFAPTISLGFDFIKTAKSCSSLPCDVHLAATEPARHVDSLVEAGCDSLTVHVEACTHAHGLLARIRESGVSPGIALNPATPLTKLDYLLPCVDRVLVMTVEAGHGGLTILPTVFERVKILKENIAYRRLDAKIQAEGDMGAKNAGILANAGVDIFVLDEASLSDRGGLGQNLDAFRAAFEQQRKTI